MVNYFRMWRKNVILVIPAGLLVSLFPCFVWFRAITIIKLMDYEDALSLSYCAFLLLLGIMPSDRADGTDANVFIL